MRIVKKNEFSPNSLCSNIYFTQFSNILHRQCPCVHDKFHVRLLNAPHTPKSDTMVNLVNGPVQLGLFYKHLRHSLIDLLSQQSFSSKSSIHHKSHTIRARVLKFVYNVHHLSCVFLSSVRCAKIYVYIYKFFLNPIFFSSSFSLFWDLVGGRSVINRA